MGRSGGGRGSEHRDLGPIPPLRAVYLAPPSMQPGGDAVSYSAKVLADSISPAGVRLLTVQVTFPRFILAEVNTHRVFSRNSASSRAIPPERLIERVIADPFVPETFNARVKGMGVGAELLDEDAARAEETWLTARDCAVGAAEGLLALDCDKSRVNRLLEPFMWHTAIISSTEWENFFALRCPLGEEPTTDFPAQLEFQRAALTMREAMRASSPRLLSPEQWHLPFLAGEDDGGKLPLISAARCARVSYERQDDAEAPAKSIERARRLEANGHLSPFEHPARPERLAGEARANFRGWVQLRELIDHQENRVGFLEGRPTWTGGSG